MTGIMTPSVRLCHFRSGTAQQRRLADRQRSTTPSRVSVRQWVVYARHLSAMQIQPSNGESISMLFVLETKAKARFCLYYYPEYKWLISQIPVKAIKCYSNNHWNEPKHCSVFYQCSLVAPNMCMLQCLRVIHVNNDLRSIGSYWKNLLKISTHFIVLDRCCGRIYLYYYWSSLHNFEIYQLLCLTRMGT